MNALHCFARYLLIALFLGHSLLAQSEENAQPRPNVLFLFADDLRADTVGCFGGVDTHTPNMDALAERGTRLTRMFCQGSRHGAVCAPSRAMLMSGRRLNRTTDNLKGIKTLPEWLREVGYETFATGKWHNGREALARAFPDARSVFLGGMCDHYQVKLCDVVAGKVVAQRRPAGHSTEHFTEAVLSFLRRQRASGTDKPFFAYVPFTAPHDPRDPPARWLERLKELPRPALPKSFRGQHGINLGKPTMTVRDENLLGWPRDEELLRDQLAEYRALVAHLDEQVGRILSALDELGYADNTLVVFTADHGLALGSHGLLGKQSLYDHSMRAPCILAGPGVPVGGSSEGLAYLYDLTATVAATAGVALDGVDGRPLWSMMDTQTAGSLDEGRAGRSELLLLYSKTQRALRTSTHKLIRLPQIDRTMLFDLAADPYEQHDLAGQPAHAERLAAMSKRLRELQAETEDELPWRASKLIPAEIDLAGRRFPADRWQPKWIRDKYWPK